MPARRLTAIAAVTLGIAYAALSSSTFPTPAFAAQPPGPTPADVATARQLFAQGLKLYNEGSFREALAAFQHAYDLAPRASLQRNIAQCHRDLKDFASAYDAYQLLLAKYGPTMSPADKRSVQRAIDELALLTGSVRVTLTDAGAAVAIDGHDAGTTPVAGPIRVSVGPHTVTVTKAGFEPIQKEVKLGGGDEVRVDGPLQPEVTTGHLVVTAPPGARVEVMVDGTDMGAAPWEGDVKPGMHVVEARGNDATAAPKQVDVARKGRVEIALDVVGRAGKVQIDTHTSDAAIYVDDQPVGKGVWEGPLPAGEHQLRIDASGYRSYRRAFLVHPGESFVEDARLESDASTPRYEGVYSGLALLGYATPSGASNFVATSCPSCPATSPLGAGLAVRVGYAFGWIMVEGMGFGSYDYSTASRQAGSGAPGQMNTDTPRNESYSFHRFGGGGMVGVRVANMSPNLRFTASALGGLAAMGNIYNQSVSAQNATSGETAQQTSTATTYVAPLLAFDAGVLVGWPNGAKFHVALLTMLQFVGSADAPALGSTNLGNAGSYVTGAQQVAAGTQVFIGPLVGFDLGL